MKAALVVVIASAALASVAACVLPPGDPCCANDVDCAAGARCFEGRCALRCTDDAQCDEGDVCVDESPGSSPGSSPSVGHVCRAADPSAHTLEGCRSSSAGAHE